jgi:phosphatidylinositol-3-phosphatase
VTRRAARALAALLTVCAIAAVASCSRGPTSPAQVSSRAGVPPSTSADVAATTPAAAASRPAHVVIVMLENKDAGDVLRDGPYLASLAASGASLTDMHAETHPSQPNYLALFSGGTQGVDDDRCPLMFDGPSLAGELTAAGHSFAGYAEDLPRAGFTGCSAGDYARKHSPWTDFTDVPAEVNRPLSAMPTDYAQLPTVSFVIPNLCHDMHDCSIAQGDAWLRANIDAYARWALTHDSLLIVSFDESESKNDHTNHIATVAVGQRVVPGAVNERTDHYRLLRTLEDLYGLPPLGNTAHSTAIAQLWRGGA